MSLVTKAVAVPDAKRSWADIVKGSEVANCPRNVVADAMLDCEPEVCISESQLSEWVPPSARKTFKPGARGARTCLCYGRLLVMLGHYGWIEARGTIDHPDAQKNGGRIYVRWRDLAGEVEEGQIVCFYLYVDEQGLGAERCQAALACDLKKIGPLSTDLEEFALAAFRLQEPARAAPGGFHVHAPAFVPRATGYSEPELSSETDEADVQDVMPDNFVPPSFNTDAAEFVPNSFEQHSGCHPTRLTASALEFVPPAAKPMQSSYGEAMCAHIANFFCDDSDDESDDELNFPCRFRVDAARNTSLLDVHVKKPPRAASSNDSTSGGYSSDSDSYDGEDTLKPFACIRSPPGLCLPELPPGLSLPPGFSVPPGLAPPVRGGMCAAA